MIRILPAFLLLLLLAACATEKPKTISKEDIRLEFAVHHANLRMTRDALSRGADPNTPGKKNFPLLLTASVLQTPEIMTALIEKGAKVNIADENGDTPLHAAVASKKTDIVELLIKHGANPNAVGKYKRTPLHEAVRLGMIDNAKVLLKHNADPNLKDEFDRDILGYAAIAPVNAIALLELFTTPERNVVMPEKTDLLRSPLLAAMKQGKPETVDYMIGKIGSFSPDSSQPLGLVAMKIAIEHNKMEWVKALTERGVKLNLTLPMAFKATEIINVEGVYKFMARNGIIDKGYTPLIWAALYKRPEIAAYLVSKGAKTEFVSNEGKSVYDYANDTSTRRAIQAAEKEMKLKKNSGTSTKK